MTTLRVTDHGRARMRQRAFYDGDLELLHQIGIEVPDGYLATRKDCADVVRRLKRMIVQLERLPGKRAVVVGDALVTAYRCSDAKRRRLMARAEERERAR